MEKIFFKVTPDQYEFPIGVCGKSELAKVHGIKSSSAKGRFWRSVIDYEGGEPVVEKKTRNYTKRKPDAEFIQAYHARINKLLEESGMTVYKLKKKYPGMISDHSFNDTGCAPSVTTVMAMAKIFNVSTDYILGLSDKRGT